METIQSATSCQSLISEASKSATTTSTTSCNTTHPDSAPGQVCAIAANIVASDPPQTCHPPPSEHAPQHSASPDGTTTPSAKHAPPTDPQVEDNPSESGSSTTHSASAAFVKESGEVVRDIFKRLTANRSDDSPMLPSSFDSHTDDCTRLSTDVHDWLSTSHEDTRITQLQVFVAYVWSLTTDDTPAINQALQTVVRESHVALVEMEDPSRVLFFCYLSCFKSLIYLELHGISFETHHVLEIVRWKGAYEAIADICLFYLLHQCGVDSSNFHSVCSNLWRGIDHDAATILLHDLKNIAQQKDQWKMSFVSKTVKLYGPKLQSSPTISLAKEVSAKGTAPWDVLDVRKPNGMADEIQEMITLIMSYVSRVDSMLGVEREMEEWESLRELLTLYRVCDHEGDVISHRSVTQSGETYGQFTMAMNDALAPIGFELCALIPGRSFQNDNADSNLSPVTSMEHTDGSTIHVVRDDGQEDWLAFICDVTYARLNQRVSHAIVRSKQLDLVYKSESGYEAADFARLRDIADSIQRKLFRDTNVSKPCPCPEGVEVIAHALVRPWGAWRGIDVVNGAVAISALTALQSFVEDDKSVRGEDKPTCWDGMLIDPEVIALSSELGTPPVSYVLMMYMSHMCTFSKFSWQHVSRFKPMKIGMRDVIPLLHEEDVEAFVEFESQKSIEALSWKGPVSERHGYLIVKRSIPISLIVVTLVLLALSALPVVSAPSVRWQDTMTRLCQNFGTIFAPLLALYLFIFYGADNLPFLQRREFPCIGLDAASAMVRRTKEEIATYVKHVGMAEEVFSSAGNSVTLSGNLGEGCTSSSGGLKATRLMDCGALFLACDDEKRTLSGMIDVGGFVKLVQDSMSKKWRAEIADMDPQFWRVLTRKEVEGVIIW